MDWNNHQIWDLVLKLLWDCFSIYELSNGKINIVINYEFKYIYIYILLFFPTCISMTKYMSPWVNRYCGNASGNKEAKWFKEIINVTQYRYGAFIISDYIPYLKWVAKLQGINTSLQAWQNELSNFIAQIMDEHKTSPCTQNWNIEDVPKDFVDGLFATPQEDGFRNLPWWCNSSFYHSEWKKTLLKNMVIFIIVMKLFMFRIWFFKIILLYITLKINVINVNLFVNLQYIYG